MYHANSDNSIDLVGSCTKYLVANKKINLYFKDFFNEGQAAQKDFISSNFAGDRRVFIVVKSYTQVYKFPIRREGDTSIKPPATLDGVGSDDLYDSFQSYRTSTPNTGLTDFLFYTNPSKTDVLIYEYEIVHNKVKSTI
jgi:hypothetical protein